MRRLIVVLLLTLSASPAAAGQALGQTAGAEAVPPASASLPAAPHEAAPQFEVRLGDEVVFVVSEGSAERSPQARAQFAGRALERAFKEGLTEARVTQVGDSYVLSMGSEAVITLLPADAARAGDESLEVYAASIAQACERAVARERKRNAIANTVLSLSLVVFLALVAFYLLRAARDLTRRLREWLEQLSESQLRFELRGIEVLRPQVWRGLGRLLLGVAGVVVQVGIAYTWLVVVLSLFETTKGYTERLTGLVLLPIAQMTGRIAAAVPLLVLLLLAAFVLLLLVRFVRLFFEGVASGDTQLRGFNREWAEPTSVLVRVTLPIVALLVVGPALIGSQDDPLGRVGLIAVGCLGLAAVPLAANVILGAITIFGRRLKVGAHVQIGTDVGRIETLGLLTLDLMRPDRVSVRVPHLKTLWTPIRVFGAGPRISLELPVQASANPARVLELLSQASEQFGSDPEVELLRADALALWFRVSVTAAGWSDHTRLQVQLLERLTQANLRVTRSGP